MGQTNYFYADVLKLCFTIFFCKKNQILFGYVSIRHCYFLFLKYSDFISVEHHIGWHSIISCWSHPKSSFIAMLTLNTACFISEEELPPEHATFHVAILINQFPHYHCNFRAVFGIKEKKKSRWKLKKSKNRWEIKWYVKLFGWREIKKRWWKR